MIKGNIHRQLSSIEGAELVVDASQKLQKIPNMPDELIAGFYDNVLSAVWQRGDNDLAVDPTSREEVTGLVRSAMGDFDHLMAVRKQLCRYVIGFVQTDYQSIVDLRAQRNQEVTK